MSDVPAGRLTLRIVAGDARFEVRRPGEEDLHPTVVEVATGGATVGSGSSADHRLVGAGAELVSRRHFLLRPVAWQWTVTDCSKNGLWEAAVTNGSEGWRQMPKGFPLPASAGTRLGFGKGIVLRLELERSPGEGGTTATADRRDGPRAERVHPDELEKVASALLAPRRAGIVGRPQVDELLRTLEMNSSTFYRNLDRLARLPEVAVLLERSQHAHGAGRSEAVAEALAIAFPYLLAPRPGE